MVTIPEDVKRKEKKDEEEIVTTPKKEEEEKENKITQPVVARDEEGKLEGVELPDGRKFFGLRPEQIRSLTEAYTEQRELPVGAVEKEDVRALEKEQQEEDIRRKENVGLAEEAGAFEPLPAEPEEIFPGESERSSSERFFAAVKETSLYKNLKDEFTLSPEVQKILKGSSPETQQEIIRDEARQEIVNEIDETTKELDDQITELGVGGLVTSAIVGGAAAEADLGAVFFKSKDKVATLKSTIEALNQMSTTIASDKSLNAADSYAALANIEKILDLRRQQIKEIALSSPSVRVTEELRDVETDLWEAKVENQLAVNDVAIKSVEGERETTDAQLLITKRRLEKIKNETKKGK